MTAYELELRAGSARLEGSLGHARRRDGYLREAVEAAPFGPVGGIGVRLESLGKRFGARTVLRDVSLSIRPGQFIAIVGRSGCGKSTLLRILAGLEQADGAAPVLDGIAHGRERDQLRIMFQDARLLPWSRVIDNVTLGLEHLPRDQRLERARRALGQVGLGERERDWPQWLSGGQRQRVALARALAHRPRLLLLDEPLGALDALTRLEMHRLIEQLWRHDGFTALLVTHDVSEAVALADRVLLIEDGRIALDVEIGLPRPRRRGPEFDALESVVLDRLLAT